MLLDAIRVEYGEFIMSCDPLVKGTTVVFSDEHVKYSYLLRGKMEALDSSTVTGTMWHAPCFEDWQSRKVDVTTKRYIAVHEDSEMICIFSNKDINLKLINIENYYVLAPHTTAVVLDGEFIVENKTAKRFVKIKPRDYPLKLIGNGSLVTST